MQMLVSKVPGILADGAMLTDPKFRPQIADREPQKSAPALDRCPPPFSRSPAGGTGAPIWVNSRRTALRTSGGISPAFFHPSPKGRVRGDLGGEQAA
jgi:hypothetical protein